MDDRDCVGQMCALALEMEALGDAIAASLDDPRALLDYTKRREGCLQQLAALFPGEQPLPPSAMLRLLSTMERVRMQGDSLEGAVRARRDRLAARIARHRQSSALRGVYARGGAAAGGALDVRR